MLTMEIFLMEVQILFVEKENFSNEIVNFEILFHREEKFDRTPIHRLIQITIMTIVNEENIQVIVILLDIQMKKVD